MKNEGRAHSSDERTTGTSRVYTSEIIIITSLMCTVNHTAAMTRCLILMPPWSRRVSWKRRIAHPASNSSLKDRGTYRRVDTRNLRRNVGLLPYSRTPPYGAFARRRGIHTRRARRIAPRTHVEWAGDVCLRVASVRRSTGALPLS